MKKSNEKKEWKNTMRIGNYVTSSNAIGPRGYNPGLTKELINSM